MTDDVKEALRLYEQKKLEVRSIEAELKILQQVILPSLDPKQKLQTSLGVFTVESKSKWTYSDRVSQAEAELKARKKSEEADGTATKVPGTPYLVYREKEDV